MPNASELNVYAEKCHYDGLGFKKPSSKTASSHAKRTRSSELHHWVCMPQSHNICTNILEYSATLRWLTAELDAMSSTESTVSV